MGLACGWSPFSALMTSISCKADLLDAAQWVFSNEIKYDSSWKEGATAWLEGNAVVTPKGEVKDILRVAYNPDDLAAMVSVSADGRTMTFDPQTDFIRLPGASKKFTIRYDKKSRKYWTLSNFVLQKDRSGADIRSCMAFNMLTGNLIERISFSSPARRGGIKREIRRDNMMPIT